MAAHLHNINGDDYGHFSVREYSAGLASKFARFQNLHRWMWNMSKMWPTCKMSKELFSLTKIGRIQGDQDMVFAIIAESRRDCIVSSYWLWLLTRGSLRPNMGVLRMARSAIMETREDSNQHVFRFCGFCSSLVSVMGRLVGCMPI